MANVAVAIVICVTFLIVMYWMLRYLHSGSDCTFGHKWGKWYIAREGWAEYPWGGRHPVTIQERFCTVCEKMESDRIDHN